ncbi:hypothetical protein F4824DRAFT_81166 [Ustulina deusta]|nr:hypothetical protein F4824DRAFT_81166 [Ustulina deusta]
MRNMRSERSRSGWRGFELVAQADTDDYDRDRVRKQWLTGQTPAPHSPRLLSEQSSPALSDSTLTDEDYLRLPIQQFDEVDLVDNHDRYAEVAGCYGPEVVDNNPTLSHSSSTKAGTGLEVRVESYPLALSPGGLYLDDRPQDFSYRGSEGIICNPLPISPSLYNYRPVPLRWRFILIVFGGLVTFLVLSQVALRLLPDASNMDEPLPAFQNITEIRKRSGLDDGAAGNKEHFIKYWNHTDTTAYTRVHSTTKVEDQPTSSAQSSSSSQSSSSTEASSSTESSSSSTESSSSSTESSSSSTESTTGPSAATPTPNDPGPNDHSNSTQTKPEAVPTDHDNNLPSPDLSQIAGNLEDILEYIINPVPETPTPKLPPSHESLPQPAITSPPLGLAEAGEEQANNKPSNQDSSKLTTVGLPGSLDLLNDQPKDKAKGHTEDQSTDQPTGQLIDQAQDQSADRQTKPNNGDTRSSSPTIHQVPSVMTSSRKLASAVSTTAATSDLQINKSKNILAQADSTSPSAQLPDHLEQNAVDKPFTTITLTLNTETPPPPITSIFTTSSSIADGSFVELTKTTTIFGHIKAVDPFTDFIITTTYANGIVSTISTEVYDMQHTSIQFDAAGKPTQTMLINVLESPQETILRDPLGYPTATLYYYDVGSTATLYNSNNIATATITTTIPETTVLSTLYDINGQPTKTTILLQPIPTVSEVVAATPTPTSSPGPSDQPTLKLQRMPDGVYFIGLMLPTLLAILVSIPIRVLNRNVKLYQGFHALASDRGASAAESLCLETTGPSSLLYGLWSLRSGQYLLGLTSILVVLSALIIPFSAEVFRLILQGAQCRLDGSKQLECSVVLGVFPAPAQVLSALLIVIIAGIILVALLLRRWDTGVKRDPWSILEMTQLAASVEMQRTLERLRRNRKAGHKVDTKKLANALRAKIFSLREWEENGILKRGVLTQQLDDAAEKPGKKADRSVTFANTEEIRRQQRPHWPGGDSVPFFILSWTGAFFNAVAFLSPYKLLRRRRLNKGQAITLTPATNPFAGIWLAFIPSQRDFYLGVVAATAILSEVLPLYLGNIPCNGVQVESAETICVYLSVTVLSVMILIVGWSLFIDWPSTMGADPSTIAGAMYAAHVFSVEQPLKRFFKKEAPSIV